MGPLHLKIKMVTIFEPTDERSRTPEHSSHPGPFPGTGLDLIKHTLRHLLALMQQLSFSGALVLPDPHAAFHYPLTSDNTRMFRNSLKL